MFKIPKLGKKQAGWAKMAIDPLGIGYGDAILGGPDKPSYDDEEADQLKALEDGRIATEDFAKEDPARFSVGENLKWTPVSPAEKLGNTNLKNISTDPRYKDAELAALRDLEEQSKNGFTASERADMAMLESQQNRANRGRLGAIQQNMQARGMSGSGMDLVAQMQSAQDSAEIEAIRALEREANMQRRKQDATARMGSMASTLQGRDFEQEAAKASAQDLIDRFNNQTTNERQVYNNRGMNTANAENWQRGNAVSDNNVSSSYQHKKNILDARQNQSGINYNHAVDTENGRRLQDQMDEERASSRMGGLGGLAGGIIGAKFGGAKGAEAGYQVGSGAGRSVGGNAYRQGVYRSDERAKENIKDEKEKDIEAFLDAIAPKSFDYKEGETGKHGVLADDLAKTKIGASLIMEDDDGMKNIKVNDAVSALLQAVAHINKKVK